MNLNHSVARGAALVGDYVARQQRQEFAEQAQPATDQTQMQTVIDRLGYCTGDLRSAIGAMSARLDPVLNQQTPVKADGADNATSPVRCPLGASIDLHADELCYLTQQLRELLARLAI